MNIKELENPVLAVDVVMFKLDSGKLKILLYKREMEPFINAYSLPGVAVNVQETMVMAVERALIEKAGLDVKSNIVYLEQLATFDALYRDVRGRTVSVGYFGITRSFEPENTTVSWMDVDTISKGSLPFDHEEIIETAIERLRGKLRYTNIAREFLSPSFRIEELQSVYELVFKKSLNRTNLRNKLLKIGLIEQKKVLSEAVGKKGGRPPHLYSFTKGDLELRDFLK